MIKSKNKQHMLSFSYRLSRIRHRYRLAEHMEYSFKSKVLVNIAI